MHYYFIFSVYYLLPHYVSYSRAILLFLWSFPRKLFLDFCYFFSPVLFLFLVLFSCNTISFPEPFNKRYTERIRPYTVFD